MIDIKIYRAQDGVLTKFLVEGHAEYARHGQDIVCSAISSTGYNAINAAKQIAGVDLKYKINDGFMAVGLPDKLSKNKKMVVSIILETIVVGFKQIEKEYGKYVHISEEVESYD